MFGLTWKSDVGALTPLNTLAAPWLQRPTITLLGARRGLDAGAAPAAVAVLARLVYAEDATVRGAAMRVLAAIVSRDPRALGTPAWRWRVLVAVAADDDPRLVPAARRLLAECPVAGRPVPAREAAIWAELARPISADQVA